MHDPEEGVTADGMIRTGARPRVHGPEHRTVIGRVLSEVPASASVYLYGSVATGTATVPTSDVDLLTFGIPPAQATAVGRRHSELAAAVCRAVALAPATADDLDADTDAGHGLRVFLRHYCVHLAGPDLRGRLRPAYPADRAAARGFNGDIADHLERWWAALEDPSTDPRVLGTRVARKTLLAAAGLVSVREGTWTTDRVRGVEGMAGQDPAIRTLGDWLRRPPAATADIAAALDGPVARLTSAFAREVGLWRSG